MRRIGTSAYLPCQLRRSAKLSTHFVGLVAEVDESGFPQTCMLGVRGPELLAPSYTFATSVIDCHTTYPDFESDV